jgi:pimeloyl-ACP methyl ester carboxylesterase
MNNRYVLIRGLVRGNGHWGDFPKVLTKIDQGCLIEFFELPGNGTRNGELTPTDSKALIADFRRRSEFCKQGQSFTVCGVSLGGMLALKWLELFPQDIRKTVVINSSLTALSPFYDRLYFKNYFMILKILASQDLEKKEKLILQLTSNQTNMNLELEQSLIEFSKRYPVNKSNFFRQLILAQRIQVPQKLKQPIYVIQSVRDRLVSSRCSTQLAHYLNAKLISHATAGHDLPLDEPAWLADFLKSIEDSAS